MLMKVFPTQIIFNVSLLVALTFDNQKNSTLYWFKCTVYILLCCICILLFNYFGVSTFFSKKLVLRHLFQTGYFEMFHISTKKYTAKLFSKLIIWSLVNKRVTTKCKKWLYYVKIIKDGKKYLIIWMFMNAANQCISMVSERSCNTEHWSNGC